MSTQDVVGIFDSGLNQLFPDARPVKANVKEKAKLPMHPNEKGATFGDHIVFEPTEIELSLVLKAETFRDTYQQIKKAWQAATQLSVQTKTDTYSNMFIETMPHDEEPDIFDTVAIAVTLKEIPLVTAQFGQLPQSQVQNPQNGSTQQTGQQTGGNTNQTQQSLAHQIFFGGGP